MCNSVTAAHRCQSLLSATANTRDLGGFPVSGGGETQRNSVWRSDAPVTYCEADEQRLKALGITTVIDLRTDGEAGEKPCAYAGRPGFTYHHLPITAGSVPPATLEDVPFTYLDIARQGEMASALRTIAEAETGVLFCCTAGKDRTGVLAALLLLACGIIVLMLRLTLHVNRGTDAGKRYTRIMVPSFLFILFADSFFTILSVLQGGMFRGWLSRPKPKESGSPAAAGEP